MAYKILCVEDSEDVQTVLRAALAGHELTTALSLSEAKCAIESAGAPYDLILLDLELGTESGLMLLSDFGDRIVGTPIVCLTAHHEFTHKAAAFALGVDDYVSKPFDPRELRLRVEARIRKHQETSGQQGNLSIGKVMVRPLEQRLVYPGPRGATQYTDLTSHEIRILLLLARTPAKIFTRSELLERVWTHEVSVAERTVDVHVSHLRKKLRDAGLGIETVIGSGYRLKTDSPTNRGEP